MSKRKGDPGYAPGWCIYYRYDRDAKRTADAICEAGVRYGDVAPGDDYGIFGRLPCFLDEKGRSKYAAAGNCPKFRASTAEEIALHEEWIEKRMDLMRIVQVGIADWRKARKGRSASEIVECPACNEKLHLSISSYNGHVHGKCETEGCVSWME